MISAFSSRSSRGLVAFTLPCVPTGINAGVSMMPCGVVNRPRRAFDRGSVASKSNIADHVPEAQPGRKQIWISRAKYPLRQRIFPLYFALTAQARESLLRGLSGFFVARITISGGALLQKNAYD